MVTRPSTTPAGVREILISEFAGTFREIDWQEFESSTFSCGRSNVHIFDLTDSTQQVWGFASLHQRSRELGHSIALVKPDLAEDLLLAISRIVDVVVQLPCSAEVLSEHVRGLMNPAVNEEVERVSRNLVRELGLRQIIGEHPSVRSVLERIEIVARVDLPALIFGETGTGKELCARAIHALSNRADRPFVPVECGAIPAELAESELFGHARGAYTDARTATLGVVGMAEGGTLFLDEIDSLSLPIQAKLLRFLQESTFRSLGSDKYRKANVRVIAASNRSLTRAVKESAFRDDLFFRLSVLRIDLPPLRDRKSDIPLLAAHFLEAAQPMSPGGYKRLSQDALSKMQRHHWPGNVRELSNVINRAVLFSTRPEILSRDIVFDDATESDSADPVLVNHNFRLAKASAVNAFERQYLNSLLQEHGGNITRAASAAGQDRSAFRRLLKKHHLANGQL